MNDLSIPEFGITITYRVELAKSRWDNPEPTLYVRFNAASPHRLTNAVLHFLAARLEAVTPPRETWCICIDRKSDLAARLYIELGDGTEVEASRAMARLRQITHW